MIPPVAVAANVSYDAIFGDFNQQTSGVTTLQGGTGGSSASAAAMLGIAPSPTTGTMTVGFSGDTDCPGTLAGSPKLLAAVEAKWSTK